MSGPKRRAFEAEMTLKYCGGNPLLAETLFGWGRHTVEVGLAESRTGIRCLGAQSAFSGRHRWEDEYPAAAEALRRLAEAHAQQDPMFRRPWPIRDSRLKRPWPPCAPKAITQTNCRRRPPWPRCSTGWGFGCVKWSKPNRKIRWLRPTPFLPTLKKKPRSGHSRHCQTFEHRL